MNQLVPDVELLPLHLWGTQISTKYTSSSFLFLHKLDESLQGNQSRTGGSGQLINKLTPLFPIVLEEFASLIT